MNIRFKIYVFIFALLSVGLFFPRAVAAQEVDCFCELQVRGAPSDTYDGSGGGIVDERGTYLVGPLEGKAVRFTSEQESKLVTPNNFYEDRVGLSALRNGSIPIENWGPADESAFTLNFSDQITAEQCGSGALSGLREVISVNNLTLGEDTFSGDYALEIGDCRITGAVTDQPIETPRPPSELIEQELASRYEVPANGLLPACAYQGTCNDVTDLLLIAVRVGEFIFQIIGSIAFLFFIYGGFVMITAFGNPERFKQGRSILVAAAIGLVIALSAFFLVRELLDILGVQEQFRGGL